MAVYGSGGYGASEVPKKKKDVPYDRGSGGYGVRASFENSGLDSTKLGWDGENVSYNGVKLKPTANIGGTTYASQDDINDFISRAYKADGKNLVQANQYRNKYGLGGLGWNENTRQVTVGGKPIDYAYIDGKGNAWVDENVISGAYDTYAGDLGVNAPNDIFEKYAREMHENSRKRDAVLSEKWSYTPEEMEQDAAWQAYKKMYERQAAKAHDDMLGKVAARNGGGMSSAAQLAAGAMYNEQMQMLSDRIPEIQQQAYKRWLNERKDKLNAISTDEQNAYNRFLAERDTSDNAYERADDLNKMALERMYEPMNRHVLENDVAVSDTNVKMTANDYAQQLITNTYQNAMSRGYFTDEDAALLGLKRRADGTLPKPWDAEIMYNLDNWNRVEKPQLDYQFGQEKELKEGSVEGVTAEDIQKWLNQ